MASFNPEEFGFEDPPPRPTTPPVRRGFLIVLFVLCAAAVAVYGSIYVTERISYAWEAGRARADAEVLAKLDQGQIVNRASMLFRMATNSVSPAVVKVQSLRLRRGGDGVPGMPIAGGNRLSPGLQGAELGSGVIIDKARGYIVTNNHVVRDADRIIVRLGPRYDVPGELVGADSKSDLAVIRVKADLAVQAEWGDSEKLEIGEWVLAIGSPLGLDRSVTAGIVSATERNDVGFSEYQSYIQTDAAINPGNSGGPLINLAGKVVGINTAIISQSGGYEGIGLAIPSAMARRVVESLIKEGKVVRGYLGVIIQAVDKAQADKLGLPNNRGALITEVQPGSPADRAGLQANDFLVKLAGHDIADPSGLKNVTSSLDIGAEVPVQFFRGRESKTVQVKIVEMPPAPEVLANFGFGVRERRGEGDQGPMIEIDQVITGGPAFMEKLRPETRILAVGDHPPVPVRTLLEFEVAVKKIDVRRGLPLIVQSGDGQARAVRLFSPRFRDQP